MANILNFVITFIILCVTFLVSLFLCFLTDYKDEIWEAIYFDGE